MTDIAARGAAVSQTATVRVAAEIRSLMARYGVTQKDLQQVLGLSQTGVSKRLRGLTPWDINELWSVAEYFKISIDELISAAAKPHRAGPDLTYRTDNDGNLPTRGYPRQPVAQGTRIRQAGDFTLAA